LKLDAHLPTINLQVESGNDTVGVGASLDIERPSPVKLIIAVSNGAGWILDVIRNGLLEMAHSSLRITEDDFRAVLNVGVHTCCTFRLACRRETDRDAVLTGMVVIRVRSGAVIRESETARQLVARRRVRGLLQRV
jgi:hypothetical protein